MLITLTFFMVVYALEAFMPYFMGAFEQASDRNSLQYESGFR